MKVGVNMFAVVIVVEYVPDRICCFVTVAIVLNRKLPETATYL